jgi:Protein of unknown function (DUF3710)
VFRRRRNAGDRDSQAAADLTAEDEFEAGEEYGDEEDLAGAGGVAAPAVPLGSGPYDIAEPHPELQRVDLGSMQVPVLPGIDIQLVFAEQHGAWVTVRHEESELQLQAFAAPKRDSLWDAVRDEIAAEIHGAGGVSSERPGPFGIELLARVPVEPGQPQSGMRPVRFTGVDGPRWFLRGLFSGAAAEDAAAAAPLEALMREIVVNRGEHPIPPRDLLELRLPPEAAQALAEEQARAEQENSKFNTPLNPFDRGPEFTETR